MAHRHYIKQPIQLKRKIIILK
jgi:hypothetical protein